MNERTDPDTSNATSARPCGQAPRSATSSRFAVANATSSRFTVANATTIATAAISNNNDPTRVRRAFLEPSSPISGVSSSVIVS